MGSARPRNSTRLPVSRTFKVSPVVPGRPDPRLVPDFAGMLNRFSEAIALVRVAQRSLDAQEIAGDEESVLRTALAALDAAYTEFDLAIVSVSKAVRP